MCIGTCGHFTLQLQFVACVDCCCCCSQHIITSFGFVFLKKRERHECYYNRNPRSMQATRYDTVLFSVQKPLSSGKTNSNGPQQNAAGSSGGGSGSGSAGEGDK